MFLKNFFRTSKKLDPDQAQRFVLSSLGLFYLQRLLADDISVEGIELTKWEPCIIFVGHGRRVDQI